MAVPFHSMQAADAAAGVADTNVCTAVRDVLAMSPNWWPTCTASPVAAGERHDQGMWPARGLAAPQGLLPAAPLPHCGTGAAGRPASPLVPAGHDAAVHVPDRSG